MSGYPIEFLLPNGCVLFAEPCDNGEVQAIDICIKYPDGTEHTISSVEYSSEEDVRLLTWANGLEMDSDPKVEKFMYSSFIPIYRNEKDSTMKKATYEQFLNFSTRWLRTEEDRKRLEMRKSWWGDGKTALDILSLEEVDTENRLLAVFGLELIEEPIQHEFACRCAERALSKIEGPDPRSTAAIAAKRAWLRGEATEDELKTAQSAAWDAIQFSAKSEVEFPEKFLERYTSMVAAEAASEFEAWYAAASVIQCATRAEVLEWQIEELKRMLLDEKRGYERS